MCHPSTLPCWLLGALLLVPQPGLATARKGQGGSAGPAPLAGCRDSRVPPLARRPSEEGPHLQHSVDVDGDGIADVLEVTRSIGSQLSGTHVVLILGGSGARFEAEESFASTAIWAAAGVPRSLLDPRRRSALAWVEEALFKRICTAPDPSLAWLLDPEKRLAWIQGPPHMPDPYAIRLPAGRVPQTLKASSGLEQLGPTGHVWLFYAGGVHAFPPADRGPVELARDGDRVLLGTAHGVILADVQRSRHAWIYVHEGDMGTKLRFASIAGARFEGDAAVIVLNEVPAASDDTSRRNAGPRQVRVSLATGAIAK